MVFNVTKSVLTDSMWDPLFWLPNATSMLRALSFSHKAVNINLGEYFLNHPIHDTLACLSAIDLTPFRHAIKTDLPDMLPDWDEGKGPIYGMWTRAWMGAKSSPEWAVCFYYIADEFVRGNERDPTNPFYFDKVFINAVGAPGFNPSLPWVFKYNSKTKQVAGDARAYINDLRALGCTMEQAWMIAWRITSRLQYLGIQDAPRKQRIDEGPWAGTVYDTSKTEVSVTVTDNKWNKGKDYLKSLIKLTRWDQTITSSDFEATIPEVSLDYKLLEIIRGYLCHLVMTYPILFPYLKGFHLTLCAHLPGRDNEG